MKVLIVDDDSIIRESLSLMLTCENDITVCGTAENGVQAVEMCRAEQPDVILMDIRMPIMDGVAATASLKRSFPMCGL